MSYIVSGDDDAYVVRVRDHRTRHGSACLAAEFAQRPGPWHCEHARVVVLAASAGDAAATVLSARSWWRGARTALALGTIVIDVAPQSAVERLRWHQVLPSADVWTLPPTWTGREWGAD